MPCLVDFALAMPLAEIRLSFTPYAEIVGTLAYLAPESTGRTGRAVDGRADLYALGAVLYELATGGPPFGAGDPLRLVRDHLARVPVPPDQVNPAVPAALSAVIMHLLEKEPDSRYQTAEGAAYDLQRVRDGGAPAVAFGIGERDVPVRLVAPSRLVGREAEVAALEAALAEAVEGRCRGVLVGGAPGVGKTALADQLRPVVAGREGWFVAGKFDPYRRALNFDGINQVSRALGRLLLAEPEEELTGIRDRILAAAGPNAGLLAAAVPELAALLEVPPEAGDPLTVQLRAQHAGVGLLRAVASRHRPVVMFVDDLQWAGRTPLGLVDAVLTGEPVEGLLLVAAHRDEQVEAAHPLAALLARWRDQAGVRQLRLAGLPAAGLAVMVAEMLRVGPAAAAGLAGMIEPHTSGNPYQTVELLNALRRDGVLVAAAGGWRWDAAAVRAYLGRPEMAGLAAARVAALPAGSRQLVETMACLGGRAEVSVLQAATAAPAGVLEQQLAAALDEGVLVAEPGAHQAVRFGHDRVREAVLAGLDPARRRAVQLGLARRLAAVPELFAVAAEQYLPVAEAVSDATERRQVAGLLQRAAAPAALIGDYALVDALLATMLRLIGPEETAALIGAHTARHAALFGLGRLEEADEEYRALEALCPAVLGRADATVVQVRSLSHRSRLAEAFGLALESLRELGIAIPAASGLSAGLDRQFGYLYRWLDATDAAGDLARPEVTDPALLAACRLIDAVALAAYFTADHAMAAWLGLEPVRIWLEHGPGHALVGPVGSAAIAAVWLRGDYAAGYRAMRRLLAVGEARGYEPDTSQARYRFAYLACWFEAIENAVQALQQAREGLIAGGDLGYAVYTYYTAASYLLDCAPTLDGFVAEVEAGLAFVRRTGSEQLGQWLDSYQQLGGVLRGEDSVAAGRASLADRHAGNPVALVAAHITGAIAAAIFGDQAALAQHAAAAMPLLSAVEGFYPSAVARLLRGLALAGQARAADGDQRAGLLAELEEVTGWLAARAADAPDNFLHLLRLLEAERAWAAGDFRAAGLAFDAARRAVAARPRPWHRALITERAARFYLAHGLDQAGYDLLTQARQQYLAWGATAKAAQLDWAYPALRPHVDAAAGTGGGAPADHPGHGAAVSTGTIDLLGIVSASQALSSPTSIGRLHARVAEVLGAMTGATAVHLALWADDRQDWQVPAPDGDGTIPAGGPGGEDPVPASVLRYVQRTGEPLVVADAAADDRFARDPYFAAAECCALLAVPVVSRGALRAVLVLENRLLRGAFTAERLDAVQLITGQLAVSLDNAQLYAELTASRARIVAAGDQARRRIERDLHDGAQQRLVSLALQLRAAQAALRPEDAALLDRAVAEATSAADELREIARGIHPAVLADGGLRPALKTVARRSPVPVDLQVRTGGRLPEQVEVTAYYVVAEALTNVARHARASAVTVTVDADPSNGVLCVAVRDDGAGGADLARGTGLAGLKDRVEALGGRLIVHSPPGSGTTLRAELPLTVTGTIIITTTTPPPPLAPPGTLGTGASAC